MRLPRQEAEPGEWQEEVNRYGGVERYRIVGGVKEFEPTINGIPQSVFFEMNRRTKEKREAEYKEAHRRAAEQDAQRRNCPFRDYTNTKCTGEACALYLDGCALSRLADSPAKDTEGLQCPFGSSKCRTDCALYNGGCTLTGIKQRKRG